MPFGKPYPEKIGRIAKKVAARGVKGPSEIAKFVGKKLSRKAK